MTTRTAEFARGMNAPRPWVLEDAVDVAAKGRRIAAEGVPYLIDGMIPAYGMLGFLVAYAKVGKTTFGQSLAAHVACGTDFLGRATRETKVLIIAAEDPPEYTAWLARHLVLPRGRLKFYCQSWIATAAGLAEVAATVAAEGIGFVLIASWQSVIRGLIRQSENESVDMVRIVEEVKAVTRQTGIPWLIDAHSGKGEDQADDADPTKAMRGSSGQAGAADYILSLRYDKSAFTTRRRLSGKGRFVTLAPLVFDFDPETSDYTLLGSSRSVEAEAAWALIEQRSALSTVPRTLREIGTIIDWVNGTTVLSTSQKRHLREALDGRHGVLRGETKVSGRNAWTYRLGEAAE